MKKQKHCIRCGRHILNGSDICYECSKEFTKYMKTHPLKTNIDYSKDNVEQKLREMREESDKRWKDFISEKVMFT